MLKKIICLIIIFASYFSLVYGMQLEYEGKTTIYTGPEVNLILNGKEFVVDEGLMPPIIVEDRTLVPVREVFERLGGEVLWNAEDRTVSVKMGSKNILLKIDDKVAYVNNSECTLDVPAKIINNKTMVPLRFISENGGLNVEWDGKTSTVSVSMKEDIAPLTIIKSVYYSKINDCDCIVVETDTKIKEYKYFSMTDPSRIAVDIYNSKYGMSTETKLVDGKDLLRLRFGKQENDVNRIVIDLLNDVDYKVILDDNECKLYIAMKSDFELPQDDNEKTDELNGKDDIGNREEVDESNQKNDTEDREKVDESNEQNDMENREKTRISGIKYNATYNRIRIIMDDVPEYDEFTLENPNRIVLDMKETVLDTDGPTTITPNKKNITSIRFSQKDDSTVRLVIDLNSIPKYDINILKKEIQINVKEIKYRNVEYIGEEKEGKVVLSDVKLKDITRKKTSSGYTISYSSSKFDTGSGTIDVKDNFVEKISIASNKITIKSPKKMSYSAVQEGNNVVITIKNKDTIKTKKIIIDVGHGGSDPGACNGTSYEKVYNLKIALKLYELLKETDGIEVVIDRKTDTYLSREDRVEFINSEEDASLLVSIHNNSVENKSYSGTMVLFYNKESDKEFGITSKEYAKNVLDELVSNLDTINRGTVSREDLHVLSKTSIPAILCEICFVSNDEELERLQTNKFQQDAAEAIYDGIMKTISEMS